MAILRTSMGDIITRVRTLINDKTGPKEVFSDEEIQTFCDARREENRYHELRLGESIVPGGSVQFLNFYSTVGGDWESNGIIQDNTWATVVPDTIDWFVGKFTFNTQPKYPIWLTGYRYDVYAIAADCLEAWAAKVMLEITFSSEGQSFSRKEKIDNLMTMAKYYRGRQSGLKVAQMMRSDTYNND